MSTSHETFLKRLIYLFYSNELNSKKIHLFIHKKKDIISRYLKTENQTKTYQTSIPHPRKMHLSKGSQLKNLPSSGRGVVAKYALFPFVNYKPFCSARFGPRLFGHRESFGSNLDGRTLFSFSTVHIQLFTIKQKDGMFIEILFVVTFLRVFFWWQLATKLQFSACLQLKYLCNGWENIFVEWWVCTFSKVWFELVFTISFIQGEF